MYGLYCDLVTGKVNRFINGTKVYSILSIVHVFHELGPFRELAICFYNVSMGVISFTLPVSDIV